jgi:16S rRNA (guanine966-N2)-methyltransferase
MSFVRITGGTLRGRRIAVPRDGVRPTSERARQAYFNIVSDRLDGARFLDLFAGTGIFALEALSRGASSAVAVDLSRRHLGDLARNTKEWDIALETVNGDALAQAKRLRGPFDLVYADPPYDFDRYDELLDVLAQLPLTDDALIAVEHRRRSEPWSREPADLQRVRRAEYGEVWITFFAPAGAAETAATPFASTDTDSHSAPPDAEHEGLPERQP